MCCPCPLGVLEELLYWSSLGWTPAVGRFKRPTGLVFYKPRAILNIWQPRALYLRNRRDQTRARTHFAEPDTHFDLNFLVERCTLVCVFICAALHDLVGTYSYTPSRPNIQASVSVITHHLQHSKWDRSTVSKSHIWVYSDSWTFSSYRLRDIVSVRWKLRFSFNSV